MKPFERHSLVLMPFPFTDRATQKRRPIAMGFRCGPCNPAEANSQQSGQSFDPLAGLAGFGARISRKSHKIGARAWSAANDVAAESPQKRPPVPGRADQGRPGALTPSPRILIVDDDPELRIFLRTELEIEGYACTEAASGQQALGLIRA